MKDAAGNTYLMTNDADRRLVLVTEPGGRWVSVNYTVQVANQATLHTLATVPAVPAANAWTELPVTDTTAYRYLQYRSASYGYGNVAEVEFYDENTVKITGTPFGATPTTTGHGPEKAFDGNTNDYTSQSFGFCGIDFGAGNEKRVSKVRYWPRQYYAGRMYDAGNPGKFSGSHEAPVSITVVASVTTSDGRSVSYDYQLLQDPVLAYAWVCLQHANYGDGTQAVYGYTQTWPGVFPQLTSVDDPRVPGAGSRQKYEYWFNDHVAGNLKAERNPADNTVIAQLDGTGSDTSNVTYADGRTRNYKWPTTAVSRVTEYTDAVGRKSTYTHSSSGQGFLTKVTDPQGRSTTYGRGTRGVLTSRTHPDGAVESWTRDSYGLVLTYTDALGRVTTWTRDALHRVANITYPDTSFETFTYNAFSQVLDHRLRNGGIEHFIYDGTGQLITSTDPMGQTTTMTYNANDRLATVTDALGHTTSYTYNERGLVTQTTHADGSTTSMAYDTYGNRTSVTDDPDGQITQCAYGGTAFGTTGDALVRLTDARGNACNFTYDLVGRKTSLIYPNGSHEDWAYDPVGNVATYTTRAGQVRTSTYDVNNRELSATGAIPPPA